MTEGDDTRIRPRRANKGLGYRDEMNFAEFPIASLSDTVAEGQKTLEFTDTIFDPSTGEQLTRTVTVTAADKFGLPTALDDEVLLGLMQISCAQGLADRKVHFSRYELIKLLGWRDESKSYLRVEESLNRWTGVTLRYVKGWWSKEEQCFVNETFHVIDQFTLFDRQRIARRRRMAGDSPHAARSSFAWNDTVFQSFRAGYIKKLDFDLYKSLDTAVSKRLFRFLDKRFFHRPRWKLDLRTLACEKLGLSRNYSNAEIKRKLLPAVRELERREFLLPLPDDERFVRVRQGSWKAVFVKAPPKAGAPAATDRQADSLARDLVGRGITPRTARKLLAHHPRARIEEKLRLFDRVKERGGEGAIRNRAGWLYSAIVHDYAVPDEAMSPDVARRVVSAPRASGTTSAIKDAVSVGPPEPDAFEQHWAVLTPDEQAVFEAEAVAAAPTFLQRQYRDGTEGRGVLWRVARDRAMRAHFATGGKRGTRYDP